MVEERQRLAAAAGRWRHPAMAHALGQWRREATDAVRRAHAAKRKVAENKFAHLEAKLEAATRLMSDNENRNAKVRKDLQEALAAGAQAVEEAES